MTADPTPDQLTAYLAAARGRADWVRKAERSRTPDAPDALNVARRNSARDVRPLLAAVEAVLAAHRPVADEKGRDRCACCRATSPTGQRALWPRGEFQIVSRALLGGEPGE